jgi:DNA-binding MarR family transcriptional regulator
VLAALRDLPAASGAELAARTFMSPQSLNELLVRLERRGLVARRPHPTHGRILEASLTPDGAARLEEADQIVRAIEGQMVHALSPVERQALARMLEACRVALSTKPTA